MSISKEVMASKIKRDAKKIKKLKDIPHYQALDEAAKLRGFENWKHFINSAG